MCGFVQMTTGTSGDWKWPLAGVKDGCVPPEAEVWSSERAAGALNPLAISPAPPLKLNIKMYNCLPFQRFTLPLVTCLQQQPKIIAQKFQD